MIWYAYEPMLASADGADLAWLSQHAADSPLISRTIVPRAIRRVLVSANEQAETQCLAFFREVEDETARLEGLKGLVEALHHRSDSRSENWMRIASMLARDKNAEVRRLARRLAVLIGDSQAVRETIQLAANDKESSVDRMDSVRDLAEV